MPHKLYIDRLLVQCIYAYERRNINLTESINILNSTPYPTPAALRIPLDYHVVHVVDTCIPSYATKACIKYMNARVLIHTHGHLQALIVLMKNKCHMID